MSIYVPGFGSPDAKLMIVGEAPGAKEEAHSPPMPFVGPTGEVTQDMIEEAGMPWERVYRTNVFKYRPPDNKIRLANLTGHTIEEGLPQLWAEIDAQRPNCILALGNLALTTLTGMVGISKWRGSILRTKDHRFKVVPSIHPAYFLRGGSDADPEAEGEGAYKYSSRYYIQLDFKRAVEEAKTSTYDIPRRVLQVCRSSTQLMQFLHEYRDKKIVSIDIETKFSIPVCIALAFNSWHAISIPLLNIKPGDAHEVQRYELQEIWSILAEFFRSGIKIIGQNFKFDHEKLLKPCGFDIRYEDVYFDTSFAAHTLHPEFPKNLAFLTSVYTREPYYKDEGKEFNYKKHDLSRLYLYNAKDAAVTYEVYEVLLHDLIELGLDDYFFNYKMKLHEFYMEIDKVGFKQNRTRQRELDVKYTLWAEGLEKELWELVGHEVNAQSPKQIHYLLYEELKFPRRGHFDKATGEFKLSADEEILVALINSPAIQRRGAREKRILELVIQIRRVKKIKGTYINAKPDYDGRMRTVYNACGTETNRSSTQIQQAPVRPSKQGSAFQTLSKHGDVGSDLRSMYEADEGCILVNVDLSQAEARIVAVLSQDPFLLECFEKGIDVHKRTAAIFFSTKADLITKKDPRRFVGKTIRHAFHYKMGKRRAAGLVNTEARRFHIPIQISEWKANEFLEAAHRLSPNIRNVFHKAMEEVAYDTRTLVNPFGTRRQFFDRMGDELFKEMCAQIPQSTVIDHIRRSAFRFKSRMGQDWNSVRVVVESHDALTFILPDDLSFVRDFCGKVKEELETPIDFASCTLSRGKLIIPCEFEIGYNYAEYDEVKNPRGLKGYELDRRAA